MASNCDDGDNTTVLLIDRSPYLNDEQNLRFQRIIEEETIRQAVPFLNRYPATNVMEIYVKVKQVIANEFKNCKGNLDSNIENIIKFFLQKLIDQRRKRDNGNNGFHKAKMKDNNDVYGKNENIVPYEYPTISQIELGEQLREEEKRLEQAIQLSKEDHDDQTEFEKELNEILAKSFEEEKSKLSVMLVTDEIDFNVLANQLNKIWPGEDVVVHKGNTMNDKSALILAIIEIFEHDWQMIKTKCFQSHITAVHKYCVAVDSTVIYESVRYKKDQTSTFNVDSINDYLVNIQIRGDGNCLWSSVSHCLFGDYTMMESLRLLTAYSLIHFYENFSQAWRKQTSQFNYNHALTLEQLIKDSVSLQSWGDEFHIMALSLALKRPIYSYGSLDNIPEAAILGYEQFRQIYELEQIPNHFKYIGSTNDANKEPILLHYDGNSHYSAVLKRLYYIKPLVPFIQIIDPLFGQQDNEIAKPGKTNKMVDDDSRMEMDLEERVEWKGIKKNYRSVRDNVEQNEIAKLKNILVAKDKLLQQYESFYRNVKKIVDQKIDTEQLKTFVEEMEDSRL